ncbi:hypothetical protein [Subtercola boreus]|uniref:hypothetical protein n=1 Tax=Subtercola boreus TaxID=120213 RepID=UPI001C0EC0E0|nr:hypothetical protein [Subtercola boreus]
MSPAVTAGHTVSGHSVSGHSVSGDAAVGRNTIAPRAVRRVVSAVTAEQLGVDAKDVSVSLSDHDGDLTMTASAPIHVAPLGTGARRPGTIVERLTRAQTTIREQSLTLTGTSITEIDLHITGVQLTERRRVS